MKDAGWQYKIQLKEAFKNYWQNFANKIKALKSGHPRKYWNILCETKRLELSEKISLDTLENHFEKLNLALGSRYEINDVHIGEK